MDVSVNGGCVGQWWMCRSMVDVSVNGGWWMVDVSVNGGWWMVDGGWVSQWWMVDGGWWMVGQSNAHPRNCRLKSLIVTAADRNQVDLGLL